MNYVFLLAAFFLFNTPVHSQEKENSPQPAKLLTPVGAALSLSVLDHGKYSLTYLNTMGGKTDCRAIIFKNKKETKSFMIAVGKAMKAKDGVSSLLIYTNYKIRLLTEIGGVFMMVSETGKSQSTFRITKDNYDQVNIL